MKYILSFLWMLIWGCAFVVAFIPMTIISGFVDAYRLAANAHRWIP